VQLRKASEILVDVTPESTTMVGEVLLMEVVTIMLRGQKVEATSGFPLGLATELLPAATAC
jgi:predicted nucleic-acid-binding protein